MVAYAKAGFRGAAGRISSVVTFLLISVCASVYKPVPSDSTRVLDEIDAISAVSGGSFTAAYYGVFGEKLFSDYEKVFLR